MINAVFLKDNEFYYAFKISGHADYSFSGNDIVCAAVSSAVDMTINSTKNNCKKNYRLDINHSEAVVYLKVTKKDDFLSSIFIKELYNHLVNISKIYPANLSVTVNNCCFNVK